MIVDHIVDIRQLVISTLQIKNAEEKKENWNKIISETVPHMLKMIQTILDANTAKKGFLVKY